MGIDCLKVYRNRGGYLANVIIRIFNNKGVT